MTHEAKRALRACHEPAWKISYEISNLKLPSLKAFVQDIEDDPGPDPLSRELSRGVRQAAEKQIEIIKARKSKKGVWYVVVDHTRWDDETRIGTAHGGVLEEVKCNGRDAAEKKARELMKEYADKFTVYQSFDFELYPEVEYEPELVRD